MSKHVLIGVGGSGQHVIHAYLRLLGLTHATAAQVPHVYIVDADAKLAAGDQDDAQLCSQIHVLHERLCRAMSPMHRPHFALIRPWFQVDGDTKAPTAAQNFELDQSDPIMVDAFLNDDPGQARYSDRTVPLMEGMLANAKIGATAFGFKIMRAGTNTQLIRTNFGGSRDGVHFDLLNDARDARVAIIGSSFGGTGSGVIPALTRYLTQREQGKPHHVRAFMTLPWFDLESSGDAGKSAAATGADGIDPKTRNAALGLRNYLDELDGGLPNGNYVVAQFPGENAKRRDNGNFNQHEHPHVFNLVLATSIQHYLAETRDNGAVDGSGTKRKLYTLATGSVDEANGVFDAAESAHLRFRVAVDDNRTLADIIKDAEVVALALEKGASYIMPGPNQFSVANADTREEAPGLAELCKAIAVQWLGLPLVKKGMIRRREVVPDKVYQQLSEALSRQAEKLRYSLLWLDQHRVGDSGAHGVKFPDCKHLFDTRSSDGQVAILPCNEQTLVTRWPKYDLQVRNLQSTKELTDSTSRTAQAFSLFENCFASAAGFTEALDSRMKHEEGSPVFDVAAQMLADEVFAAVMAARDSARDKRYLKDAADEQALPNQTGVFLRATRVEPTPESSRLCVIGKAALDTASGDPGRSNYSHPIEETHPLSLRQIDPYLGIGRVEDLQSGRAIWLESALSGIPNVLAAKLIQLWRMKRRPTEGMAGAPLAQSGQLVPPRLSEAGLYRHACQVVEAAFWLLFTRDPRVKWVPFGNEERLGRSHFAALLNQEYRSQMHADGHFALPSHALVLQTDIGELRAGKVLFVNDPECGWFLAANVTARRFFTQIYAELPSVKYGSNALDQVWRGNPPPPAKPERGSFEAAMIRAFVTFLESTAKPFLTKNLPWANAMRDIAAQLIPLIDTDMASPTLDSGESSDGYPVRRFTIMTEPGKTQSLAMRSPAGLRVLQDLFIERPIFFYTGEDDDPQWAGIWPLKGSAWQHIEPPEQERALPLKAKCLRGCDSGENLRPVWKFEEITLHLRELGKKPFHQGPNWDRVPGSSINKTEFFNWRAMVWPNFSAPDWRYYLVNGMLTNSTRFNNIDLEDHHLDLNQLDLEFVFYGDQLREGGKIEFGEIGRVRKAIPVKLKGIPRAVELRVDKLVLGSMPIRLPTLPLGRGQPSASIGLDFGTSNTCMAYRLTGTNTPHFLPLLPNEPLGDMGKLPDQTLVLQPLADDEGDGNNEQVKALQFLFQSANVPDRDGTPRSIPSELRYVLDPNPQLHQPQLVYLEANADVIQREGGIAVAGANERDLYKRAKIPKRPVVTPVLTPIPPAPRDRGRAGTGEIEAYLEDAMEQNFKSEMPYRGAEENYALRAVYLEQILAAGCAALRRLGIRSIDKMVATVPGAFDDPYRKTYGHHLGALVNYLFNRTGLTLGAERSPLLLSETIAALTWANAGADHISITIDMGGGTTDVGIIVPGMQGNFRPFSYMNSLNYAGNDLLGLLLRTPDHMKLFPDETDERLFDPENLPEDFPPERLFDAKLNRLKMSIRNGGTHIAGKNFNAVATAFFEGMFEYVLSLLAAIGNDDGFPGERNIEVYLVGNGFRLTEIFFGQDAWHFFESVKNTAVQVGLLPEAIAKRISNGIRTKEDTKLALIQGALQFPIVEDDADLAAPQQLLRNVEKNGHGRVAIWYPCVSGGPGFGERHRLGDEAQRASAADGDEQFLKTLEMVEQPELLKMSFPITSKYWDDRTTIPAIFRRAPKRRLVALGHYYLCGQSGAECSYYDVVLKKMAEKHVVRRVGSTGI